MRNDIRGRIRQTLHVLIYLGVVLRAGAEELLCSVTVTDDRVTYNVTGPAANSCDYSWSSGTSRVLANYAEEPSHPVTERSQESLTTVTCLEAITYQRECMPEGVQEKALCTAVCKVPEVLLVAFITIIVVIIVAVVIAVVVFISVRKKKMEPHEAAESNMCLAPQTHTEEQQ